MVMTPMRAAYSFVGTRYDAAAIDRASADEFFPQSGRQVLQTWLRPRSYHLATWEVGWEEQVHGLLYRYAKTCDWPRLEDARALHMGPWTGRVSQLPYGHPD